MSNIQNPINGGISNLLDIIHRGEGLVPFSQDIFLISLDVAGTSYIEDIEILEPELIKGTHLKFFREAKNYYDERAILIKYYDKKIGYIPKISNEILANLMDAGKLVYGVVDYSKLRDDWLQIRINVFLRD